MFHPIGFDLEAFLYVLFSRQRPGIWCQASFRKLALVASPRSIREIGRIDLQKHFVGKGRVVLAQFVGRDLQRTTSNFSKTVCFPLPIQ
jgi:hypothetical protein